MSLCSIKRRQSVVKALAWLSCALFTLIVCSILVGLAVALAIELKAIEENIPDGSDSSGNESGDAVWSNPYNIFTTTTCGQYGISLKIEHSSKTHILNEEVFGTVAFIGLSRANTWDIMGLLDLSYDHDFDAIAISPPGHGNTTQVEEDGGGFWSPANFLKNGLESCLGVSLAKTVVVSHSNFVTRKYFLPLLMSEIALGFVLFDSSVGTEWMDEYDTDVNDHKFYQVRTKHYRGAEVPYRMQLLTTHPDHIEICCHIQYVGKRRLAAAENIIQALEASYRMRDSPSVIDSSPLHADSPALQQQVPRILAATSLKGYCRAEPEGPDDAFPTNSTLGPFDFFPGKYKLPGWDTARRRYRETPLDAPADEGMETRLVNSEYFAPLRTALAEFLEELKSLSLQGKLQAEQPRPLRFNNRQVEYDKSRENTTKVDPMAVYCIQESATEESVARSGPSSEPPIVHLVDPEKYLLQKKAKALRSSSTTTAPTHATRRRPIHSPPMEVGFSIGAIISNWKP